MENTKDGFLIENKKLNLGKIENHLKKYLMVYVFCVIMAVLILLDLVLLKRFIEILSNF